MLLTGVALFIALTRTQVGRDGLRHQIERQFADAFEGRLEIGRLKGNLAQQLFASDVRLYDGAGRLVAQVDSIVASPNWRSLFRKRISIGSITLIQPTCYLIYQADGAWNADAVFGRRGPRRPGSKTPWAFESAEVLLVDGAIHTRHEAARPPLVEQGWLFNFAHADVLNLQARATVEWDADTRLIDVLRFSASVPQEDFTLDELRGQFLLEEDALHVNQFALQTGRTDVRLDASLNNLAALRAGAWRDVEIDIELQPSQFDYDQWRRLAPRLPLADVVSASARVRGPLAGLVVEEVTARRGQSRLLAEGILLGLPDSLDFDVAVRGSAVASTDLRAVLPKANLPDLDHLGLLALNLTAQGVAQTGQAPPRLRADARLDVRGTSGHVQGAISLAQQAGQALRYTLTLDADSLDLGRIAQDDGLASALNGHVEVRGRGLSLDSLHATLRADLRASRFAGRRADTIHVDASAVASRLEATAFARQRNGTVYANAVLNLNTRLPSYRLGLITRRLDLGPLLGLDSLQSSLNTTWTLDGAGASWRELSGQLAVAFDSSTVRWRQRKRVVPPHRTTLTLNAPDGTLARVDLAGDVLALRLDGDAPLEPLTALAALWRPAFDEAVRRQLDKPYRRRDPSVEPASVPLLVASLDQISRQEAARRALQAAGLDTLRIDGVFALKRPDVLAALLPMLPPMQTNLRSQLRLAADADRLRLDASFSGDSLQIQRLRADAFRADLQAAASLDAPLEKSLTLALAARADSVHVGGQSFRTPSLTAHLAQQEGQFTLTTGRNGQTGPARLAAAIDLLPDRNRLTLLDFHLALGNYVWTNPEDQALDLYDDVAVVPGLLLESQAADGGAPQRLRLRGIVSSAPEDTLFVDIENIGLRQLSTFLALKPSLGGRLDGRLALTGAERPELTGALSVEALALDDNVIGQLAAASRYVPGAPDVALDLHLTPLDSTAARGGTVRENRLRLGGVFRLPRSGKDGAPEDPGALDLKLNAERADLFFFEYIFPNLVTNVGGALAGTGAIRGTFKKPRFEADMLLAGGRFDVPQFNLRYLLDGRVRVDDEAIRLDEMSLADPTGGAATISGAILFNDYRFFSFDLAAALREVQIIDVPSSRDLAFYGRIWASGNATLTGPVYNTLLKSSDVVTSPRSEIFIPLTDDAAAVDPGFIVFTDSTGQIPDQRSLARRDNILARRPVGERGFTEGMDMDLNIFAPQGSTVHLVIDPLLGDEINAVGSGRIQLQRQEGEFFTFGALEADAGDYLFTAGEVFVRRFLINEGTISWDGDPLDARLNIQAAYRTRASRTGLPDYVADRLQPLIPLIVQLHITGRVSSPLVDLDLAVDRSDRETTAETQFLETFLNQSDRAPEYATSVLLTNSFLLTTEGTESNVLAGSAFNSVSQLVSSQLNRYLSQVVPNTDFSFGVQGDEAAQDLDVTAGLAIRLLNERLVIRGQGVYRGLRPASDDVAAASQQGLQGEFVVEIRLSPSVSVEFFYRREGDVLSESILTSTTGAGLSYNTQFPTWRALYRRLFGKDPSPAVPADSTLVNAQDGGK